MKLLFRSLCVTFGLCLMYTANVRADSGDANYQVVVASDGSQHIFPADLSVDVIVHCLEEYDYYLEIKEWYEKSPRLQYC